LILYSLLSTSDEDESDCGRDRHGAPTQHCIFALHRTAQSIIQYVNRSNCLNEKRDGGRATTPSA
jgi:hypothetical protein